MINALGAEVDRLEADVAKLCPGIRHIDLVGHVAALVTKEQTRHRLNNGLRGVHVRTVSAQVYEAQEQDSGGPTRGCTLIC